MRRILLIMIGLSVALMAGLSKSGNIVTDSVTGLQWQDDTTGSTMTWRAAIDHCEGLTLDSHTDWRLPNLRELTSIVDDTKNDPSINNTTAFEHTASYNYWSSTTYAGSTSNAWRVYFYNGYQYYFTKSGSYYVRCVRAGQ